MRSPMLKTLVAAVLLLLAPPLPSAVTPAKNSPVRKALLDALRPAIEAKIGPNVEFVVSNMRVGNGWAFVQAEPQRRGGRRIDGRSYFPNDWENMDGLTVTAILKFQNRRWNLVDHAIGATDAWYCGSPPMKQLLGC